MPNEFNADEMSDEAIKASLGEEVVETASDEEKPEADPEAEPVDDADKAEKTDPEAEAAEKEEAPALDPYQQQFQDLGLEGQYADPADVLNRAKRTNAYLDEVHKKNAVLRDRLAVFEAQRAEKAKDTPEEIRDRFDENPEDAMRRLGFVRAEDVKKIDDKLSIIEERQSLQSMASAAAVYPELKEVAVAIGQGRHPAPNSSPVFTEMMKEFNQKPWLNKLEFHELLSVLYEPAKARVAAGKRATVPRVPPKDKAGANTNAGNAATRKTSDEIDYSSKTADEIFDDYAKRDMVGR